MHLSAHTKKKKKREGEVRERMTVLEQWWLGEWALKLQRPSLTLFELWELEQDTPPLRAYISQLSKGNEIVTAPQESVPNQSKCSVNVSNEYRHSTIASTVGEGGGN